MALIKPTTHEEWRSMAAALELISARAAMLAQSAQAHRFQRSEWDRDLAMICTLANDCRAVAGLKRLETPS